MPDMSDIGPGPAAPPEGFIQINDDRYPILRQCRTVPLEGLTGSYSVISYVFEDGLTGQVDAIDRWFDEGGATGVYFGESTLLNDYGVPFDFEFIEGDFVNFGFVNPLPTIDDNCGGTVLELDADLNQIRRWTVLNACTSGGTDILVLSEDSELFVERAADGESASVSANLVDGERFFFGTQDVAFVNPNVDANTVEVIPELSNGATTRTVQATYPVPQSC